MLLFSLVVVSSLFLNVIVAVCLSSPAIAILVASVVTSGRWDRLDYLPLPLFVWELFPLVLPFCSCVLELWRGVSLGAGVLFSGWFPSLVLPTLLA